MSSRLAPTGVLPLLRCTSTRRLLCRFCKVTNDFFSTSSRAYAIAPESPRFIPVPQPPQPSYPPKKHVKGFLPVPREIFPPRAPDKGNAQYLAGVTREPQKSADRERKWKPAGPMGMVKSKHLERSEWKRRMAATRRRNLREGLVELQYRRDTTQREAATRSARKRAERQEALYREQREDERLTLPSVTQAMQKVKVGILPDPHREARMAEKRTNVAATMAKQSSERQRALHELYINARYFITTEEQLNNEIDKVFMPRPKEWGTEDAHNVWSQGPPPTTQDMLNQLRREGQGFKENDESYVAITEKRLMRIGEELTGGKIIDPDTYKLENSHPDGQ